MSVALHSIRLVYKLLNSYHDRSIQNTVKHLRRRVFQKIMEPGTGHFDKRFVKNTRKRGRAGKHFGVFSLRYS